MISLENPIEKINYSGASSGIGKATAIKLLESGYQVFGLARRYEKLVVALSHESPSKEKKKINIFHRI